MAEDMNFPAIKLQVSELVLAGSNAYAEEALSEAAEQYGDLVVAEVVDSLEPQVAAMHLSSYDGGKLSLATLLISPKAWAESLAFFAATWSADMIEDDPEKLTESLFAHIHGIVFASDDPERRAALLHEALATDWGTTAFAVLFSTARAEIIEIANEIYSRGVQGSGPTTSDHDVIPLVTEIVHADEEAWDRVLFELFPDWHPGENHLPVKADHDEDDEEEEEFTLGRSTRELLLRLRKQVPGKDVSKPGDRVSLGEDIFE